MVSIPLILAHRAFTGECPADKRWCMNPYSIDIQPLTGYFYVELTLFYEKIESQVLIPKISTLLGKNCHKIVCIFEYTTPDMVFFDAFE